MLYLVATPIGNLEDFSKRGIEVLEKADILLCEDTRVVKGLLDKLNIENKPQLVSYFDQVEQQKIPQVVEWLEEDKNVALVSDAGSPLISDPGYRLVARCRDEGLQVTSIPGPSAVVNALLLSGLPAARFCFLGFLPKKSGDRKKILGKFKEVGCTKVVYESPFRVERLVEEIEEIFGSDTMVSICREMTKKFEEVVRGKAKDLRQEMIEKKIKGEITVVFT